MIENSLLKINVMICGEIRTHPSYHWKCDNRGTASYVVFQYTRQGYGVFEKEGQCWNVPVGHAFLAVIPESANYYYPTGEKKPWVFDWINFVGEYALQICRELKQNFGSILPLPVHSEAEVLLNQLQDRFTKGSFANRFDQSHEIFRFLMTWWKQLDGAQDIKNDPVERALQRIRDRSDETIGVKELATYTGLSREHFTRMFIEQTHVSPGQFLRHKRLERAQDLLKSTSLSIQDIAAKSGFSSSQHFREAFRKAYGYPPRRYRAGKSFSSSLKHIRDEERKGRRLLESLKKGKETE